MNKNILISLLILVFASSCNNVESAEIKWEKDLATAMKKAKDKNLPIMIDVYTDWCTWCKELDKNTYSHKEVIDMAKKMVAVKLNPETSKEGAEVAQKYGVQGFPTILFINADGLILENIGGYVEGEKFVPYMKNAIEKLDKINTVLASKEPSLEKLDLYLESGNEEESKKIYDALMAKKAIEDNKFELASHQYRMASRYFAIAAYPNLKGDVLAAEASLYGRKAYREIFVNSKRCGYYSEEEFTVRGKKVIGYLHSPDNKDLHPCVVMLGAYDQTATDFFRIFNDELRPLGIAAFVVDMPGMGNSGNLVLDENYSEIAENAILHLKEKGSFIDSTKIGLFGLHLSAAAAVRLAVLRSDLVNGLVVLDPTVHNIFTNVNYLSDAPLCLRSSIANRLNADASNWDTLMPQLRILSLKQQGLLSASGKCPVNCYVAVSDGDRPLVDDAHAVADAFRHNDFVDFKEASADLSFARASKLVGKFFKEQFT